MQLLRTYTDGGSSHFCACRPGGTWRNQHPVASQHTPLGKQPFKREGD
jgi:hypothetical protein